MFPKIEAADATSPEPSLSSDPDWSREVYLPSARGYPWGGPGHVSVSCLAGDVRR